jgi:hypothetical protein
MSAHIPVGLKIPPSRALRRNIEVGVLIATSKTVSCLDEIYKLYGEDFRMTPCIGYRPHSFHQLFQRRAARF